MKVCLIKACAESKFKQYKKYMGAPPQSIFSMAAATPKDIEVQMVDETVNMCVYYQDDIDLTVIFMSTPDAYRAYEIADEFKKRGKTVILSGLHTAFNRDEALEHGDALLIGECEGIWQELLKDYEKGSLKKIYQKSEPTDLSKVNPYPTHLLKKDRYNYVWSVLVSRGCSNRCNFCLVHKFFGGKIRYRPIEAIVEEIKACGCKTVELHSDYLTSDRNYAIELFKALIPLNINWVGETTIDIADDEELLNLAAKSGLKYLLVGIETPSNRALKGASKGFVDTNKTKERIEKLHRYGIIVDSAMLFGFDQHDSSIFEDTLKFVRDINLDIIHAVIPIPFPGSSLYESLDKENRIITKDWSLYDGRHVVFKHPTMSEEEIEKGMKWFENRSYSIKNIYRYYKNIWKIYKN